MPTIISLWIAILTLLYVAYRLNQRAAQYADLVAQWEAYANDLESRVDSAQTFALNVANRRKGRKGELPLLAGKSKTQIVKIDGEEFPAIKITEFVNRRGQVVKLEENTPDAPAEKSETPKTNVPESARTLADVLKAIESELGTLTESETTRVNGWLNTEKTAHKPTSEYVGWIKGIRKGQNKKSK